MDISSTSNSSELIPPLVPGLTSPESLTSVLASDTGLLGIPYTTQGSGSTFKEDFSTSSAELSLDTSTKSEALSSNALEMAGNEPSKILQSFLTPIAAINSTSSMETVDEGSTPDPVTGLSDTAQLVGTTSATINFQPSGAPVPTGYTADTGAAYGSRGNGRTYGWVRQDNKAPLNISSYARDRNSGSTEQRIDTLIHMQYPNTAAAAWEYALPNGKYSVTVSVGDQSPFDSTHRIRAEGIEVVKPFKGSSSHKFELGTATVNVSDGKLTIDASGGTNTKINYLEFSKVSDGSHPRVTGSSPTSRQTGVSLSSAVNADVGLVTAGQGVDSTTLNTSNVRLYRTFDNQLIDGNINTSGGGDAIVYQPKSPLQSNMHYTFRVKEGVKDENGVAFLPFSTTFTTGSSSISKTPGVNFTKSEVYTGAPISTLLLSPNKGQLYGAGLDGSLRRWNINSSGDLVGEKVFKDGAANPLSGRAIIGMAFNPRIKEDLYLWTTNNNPIDPANEPAEDFSGKITKISLKNTVSFDGTIQDYVVGLPRSAKDHLSNSLVFGTGTDNALYMTQGSNSAMGAPDAAWYNRPERLLSGAVLRIDQTRTTGFPFNVQTENYNGKPGNYNPYAKDDPSTPANEQAPVTIYATGVRNAYDLVWHSNGKLYVPTNGSAAGGNTPDNPNTTANEGLKSVATQNDYLFKVEKDGYYGHPNPKRGEYILNGGNPTSGVDPAEVVAKDGYAGYTVGTQPDPNYKGFAYDFGRNRSPNGVTEYKSSTFNGALKNQLLVTEYSGGDDILALKLDANGNVTGATQAAAGLSDPLDVVEDTKNTGNIGTLYVAELPNGGASGGRITRFRPA